MRRTFFRPERPTLTSRSIQSITRPFQKRFREVFGNARILIFYLSIKAWEEKSLPKSHLGWFFLVFGEGKGTKENMSFFWFIWPLTCICKQKTVLPVSSINLSQTDKALPVKTSEPNFVTFFRSSLFDYLWNFFVCYGSKAGSHFVRNHGLLVRWAPVVTYNFDILKFILCCEAWRIITKEIVLRLINDSFLLFYSPKTRSQVWILYIEKCLFGVARSDELLVNQWIALDIRRLSSQSERKTLSMF